MRVAATISPSASLFGDTRTARVEVAVDPHRVDPKSIRIEGRFEPFAVVEPPLAEQRRFGGRDLVEWSVRLRCLEHGLPAQKRRTAGRAAADTRELPLVGGDRPVARSLRIDWPDLLVYSRVDQVEAAALSPQDQPPWRAEIRSFPSTSFAVPPGLFSGVLFAVSGIMVLFALLLCVPLTLRHLRAQAEAGRAAGSHRSNRRSMVLESSEADGDVEPRRQALELVAAELGRRGEEDLELSARRLAWSEEAPPFEDTHALARSVRSVAQSSGNNGGGE